MTSQEIIQALNLIPHPKEGGFFRETYRSDDLFSVNHLPVRYIKPHCANTAIYYLLTPETFSEMHRLITDEIFHFYMGDPVSMLQLYSDGSSEVVTLGTDLLKGQMPQVIVPKNIWQGSRIEFSGQYGYALLGTTVSPGFEFEDYETGEREKLIKEYPSQKNLIVKLTRDNKAA